MLDEQLQPDLELMPDDDARAMCMEIIDNKNVADIRDYPVKSYLTRVQENGRSYDVAVVAGRIGGALCWPMSKRTTSRTRAAS